MDAKQSRELNQQAFPKLKPIIDRNYPPGRFVALYGGEIVGDAASFDELQAAMRSRGFGRDEILVEQAGAEHLEFAYILMQVRTT